MNYLLNPDNWAWISRDGNLRFLIEGFLVNLQIALVAGVLTIAFALLLALSRVSRSRPLSLGARLWIDLWRNLPTVFVILFIALLVPQQWRQSYEAAMPDWLPVALRSGPVFVAILGLSLFYSAVIAEIFRAGIQSLARGQREAAAALGFGYVSAMRLIILPQALRRMLPATISQLISLNKNTTLVSIVGIQEVLRNARIVSTPSFLGSEPAPILQVLLVVGAMFVLLNFVLSRLAARLEARQTKQARGARLSLDQRSEANVETA
jgi:His/Glu/Gln/Arg/opine family amino acid ABC transporter permease subunit